MEQERLVIEISLPEALACAAVERTREEGHAGPDAYVRALVLADLKRRDEERLEAMLLEGLESGPGVMAGSPEWEEFWDDLRAQIRSGFRTERA